jgi:hypothetical protein
VPVDAEVLAEHAYLVARGVRCLAIVGRVEAGDSLDLLRLATQVEGAGQSGAVPFVIDNGDGTADCGYATAAWALDLYRWAKCGAAGVPPHQADRIIGLLCAYSAEAIRRFEEEGSGRLFGPTASPEPASSSPLGDTRCTEENAPQRSARSPSCTSTRPCKAQTADTCFRSSVSSCLLSDETVAHYASVTPPEKGPVRRGRLG